MENNLSWINSCVRFSHAKPNNIYHVLHIVRMSRNNERMGRGRERERRREKRGAGKCRSFRVVTFTIVYTVCMSARQQYVCKYILDMAGVNWNDSFSSLFLLLLWNKNDGDDNNSKIIVRIKNTCYCVAFSPVHFSVATETPVTLLLLLL